MTPITQEAKDSLKEKIKKEFISFYLGNIDSEEFESEVYYFIDSFPSPSPSGEIDSDVLIYIKSQIKILTQILNNADKAGYSKVIEKYQKIKAFFESMQTS
jgi:effector-binding domain-containing protein